MNRRNAAVAVMLMLHCAVFAQTKTPTHFDVIAVKPHQAGDNRSLSRWTSSGYEMSNISLRNMIASSARVQTWLVSGLPPWAESARWDISAKITDSDVKPIDKLTFDERIALVDSILHDRFALVLHRETKVQPVFVMTVLPDGPKFKQSPPPPPGEPEPKFGRAMFLMNNGVAEARYLKMSGLAETLSRPLERTVVDRTGLTGEYDFKLKWRREDRPGDVDNGADSDAPPTIIEAVKEQLGLKMTADKAPVPTVVVDSIQQPEAN